VSRKSLIFIITIVILGVIGFTIYYFNFMRLSHPEIYKGVKLGMDYDKAMDSLIKNEGCESDIEPKNICQFKIDIKGLNWAPLSFIGKTGGCQFTLTSEIWACPSLFSAKFQGRNVVCYAILLFHSPEKFEKIEVKQGLDIHGFTQLMIYDGMPAVNKEQMDELIEMFEKKYGPKKSKCKGGEYCWTNGDLIIELYCRKYGERVDIGGELDVEAYQVFALYRYNEKMNKLIEYPKESNIEEKTKDKI
jgi:hypothetical protein